MKRKMAFNPMCLLGLLVGTVMAGISIALLTEQDGAGWFGLILALVLLAVAIFITPVLYLFDEEGVTCVYLVFSNERYLWKRISSISLKMDSGRYNGSFYQIKGIPQGERKKYLNGEIRKTFRTKRLLHRYYNGTIEGESTWKGFRSKKKKGHSALIDADEVMTMEREMRARVKEALIPIMDRAGLNDLTVSVEYLYAVRGGEYLRQRPKDKYVYLALASIAQVGEKDKRKKVQVSSELIRVRLGGSAYIGVEEEEAITALVEILSDTLDMVVQNGINSYRKDWED